MGKVQCSKGFSFNNFCAMRDIPLEKLGCDRPPFIHVVRIFKMFSSVLNGAPGPGGQCDVEGGAVGVHAADVVSVARHDLVGLVPAVQGWGAS